MDASTERYLSFGRPVKGQSFLWPVRIWKVLAPAPNQAAWNLFQRTIMGLLSTGRKESQQIADWMKIEPDMVRYIMVSQLQPNGWIDNRAELTALGKKQLEDALEQRRELGLVYLFQDRFSGQLWPRISGRLRWLQPERRENGYPVFRHSRNTGKEEKPFRLEAPKKDISPPNMDAIRQCVQQANNAIHNQKFRGGLKYEQQEVRLDEVEQLDTGYVDAWVLCRACKDDIQGWRIVDPLGATADADFMREQVYLQAQHHQGFARRLNPLLGDVDLSESWQQVSDSLTAQVDFTLFTEFVALQPVPYLSSYLGALLRQLEMLEAQGPDAFHFEMGEALITQGQKVLECCFQWMLSQWPLPEKFISRGWKNDDIATALRSVGTAWLTEADIDNLQRQKSGAIFYAAKHQTGSIRPLLTAVIFSLQRHSNHPLASATAEQFDIGQILKLADARNQAAHASGEQASRELALEHGHFVKQWLTTLAGILR